MHSLYPEIVDKGHRWPATGYGALRIKTDRLDPASRCFATGFQRLANARVPRFQILRGACLVVPVYPAFSLFKALRSSRCSCTRRVCKAEP